MDETRNIDDQQTFECDLCLKVNSFASSLKADPLPNEKLSLYINDTIHERKETEENGRVNI